MKTKIALILMISGLIVFRSTSKFSADVTGTIQNGSIVFVGGDGQLYTVMPDGSRRRQLTQPPSNSAFPAWSQDGKRIAFTSLRSGNPEIWTMNANGSNQKQLTHSAGGGNFVPSWSPDGKQITFSSIIAGHPEIRVMNSDGSQQKQLTNSSANSNAPCWSPDGNRIAFASNRTGTTQIYTMNPDGNDVRQRTRPAGPNFSDSNVPVWSPDGKKIAFWSGIEQQYGQIWIMDADGSNRNRVTNCPSPSNCDNPAWSPDGRFLLFETNRSGIVETWIMNANGTNQRKLLDFAYGAGRLPWQLVEKPEIANPKKVKLGKIPDEEEIVYIFGGNPFGGFIYVMDKNGNHVTQITFEFPRNYEHAAVSYDHRYVIANEQKPNPTGKPGGISQLWVFDLEKGTEARLLPGFDTAGNGGVDWDSQGFIYFAAKEKDLILNPSMPEDFMKNAGANDIYKIRYDGTGLRRLMNTTKRGESDVSVSEDGTLLSFGGFVFPQQRTEIRVMNSNGNKSRLVYGFNDIIADPELSPDNSHVVFSKVNHEVPPNWPNIPGLNTAHDLYSINRDGSGLTRLTKTGPISIVPDWREDLIVYTELNENENYQGISMIKARGKDQTPKRIKRGGHSAKWIRGSW